jgi:hypothetical protein
MNVRIQFCPYVILFSGLNGFVYKTNYSALGESIIFAIQSMHHELFLKIRKEHYSN